MVYDVCIAGGGIVGCMTARELSRYKITAVVTEKQNDVAVGATKANSGIVHGGYDPIPGTLKAALNAVGAEKLFEAAKELNVPCKQNGSFVCAFNVEEEKKIHSLYSRGKQNGVKDLEIITGDEAREKEPRLSKNVTLVLNVPTAGIVSPYKLAIAAMGNAMDNGVDLERNFEISDIRKDNGIFILTSSSGKTVKCRFLVNCAGVNSGVISEMAGGEKYTIIPRSGEYMLLDKNEGGRVSRTIFQVPTKAGKGILVTPTADGNLLIGPTSMPIEGAENTRTTVEGLKTVAELSEKSVPNIDKSKVITSFTGIRATVAEGDFIIKASEKAEGLINAAAIDSPGLTCSVAIAEYIVELLKEKGLSLEKKPFWTGERDDGSRFNKMDDEEKNDYVKQHPEYGRIICRCEGITEGEIRDCLRQNPKPLDMDGVKRRTRSGMGRCQGGFCAPYVMKLISEECGIPAEDVTKKGSGSKMLEGRL